MEDKIRIHSDLSRLKTWPRKKRKRGHNSVRRVCSSVLWGQ